MPERTTPRLARDQWILLADLARGYYVDDRSKVELADRFGLSRFQVAKLLRTARDEGVVSIDIRDPRSWSPHLHEGLAEALGIDRVQVVDIEDVSDEQATARVGSAVMQALKETVRAGDTVGISWSRTLDAAARSLPELPPCVIVQLAGALQLPGAGTLPQVIQNLGSAPGITTLPIHAPLLVDRASTASDLRGQPEIKEALDRADSLDVAVVAIGGWLPGESSIWEKTGDGEREQARASGAVGEISGRLFDSAGRPVVTPSTSA
ncbi:DeoR family transcriptional regulator [Frondihabitans sucicola]|uniref:DeoR family transcriptional regulator n=1 Tax=Frondihabitans sucicola TaxID=1268041 RepID=A0ABM8GJB0_9MICO|nr:DeoR family transcriptional regulator [Frondihabitans sucicola]